MTVQSHFNPQIRSLALPAGAAAAAATVALGGTVAVFVAFAAVVLAADRLFPAPADSMASAERSFKRLSRERRRRDSRPLELLDEDEGWAAAASRRALGVQEIPVGSIVGTVEPARAAAFDDDFRPPRWTRERWTRMWLAVSRGTTLPPISVYRVGDTHFVRDGHHRVSVARAVGAVATEAEVVELQPANTTSMTRRSDQ
jgi:hypothetical protein